MQQIDKESGYVFLLQLIASKGAKGAMATQCEAMESDGDSKLVFSHAESGKKRELPDDVLDKPKQFKFCAPPKAKPRKIPKVADRATGMEFTPRPPQEVLKLLGDPRVVIGVDIKTHDWSPRMGFNGGSGKFGFFTRCNSDYDEARVVQIGWAVRHDGDASVDVQERIVKQDGHVVSQKKQLATTALRTRSRSNRDDRFAMF